MKNQIILFANLRIIILILLHVSGFRVRDKQLKSIQHDISLRSITLIYVNLAL